MNFKTTNILISPERGSFLRSMTDSVCLSFVLAIYFGGQSPPLDGGKSDDIWQSFGDLEDISPPLFDRQICLVFDFGRQADAADFSVLPIAAIFDGAIND